MEQMITGSEALLRALIDEGVDTIFGYPGGQAIPIYDSLYDYRDKLRHILVRHEQGATHAAQGYARVSGKVGVTLVTSGPGATNTITGIADAMMDSTPIVVIAGQVPSPLLGTDAFQEIDVIGITQPITKWAYQIRKPEEIAWAVSRAFYIASTGRPGPVVLDFAKDAQVGMVDYQYKKVDYIRSYQPEPDIKPERIRDAAALINAAQKPFCLVGQGVILGGAEEEMKAFLQKNDIPAGCTTLGLSALPSDFPLNKGMLGMHGNVASNTAVSECDLLFSIGTRFNDRITGKISEFAKNAKIIHIDIDAASISRNIVVDVPIVADAKEAIEKFSEIAVAPRHGTQEWVARLQALRAQAPIVMDTQGRLNPQDVIQAVNEHFPEAIVTTDVGQNQMWTTQFLQLRGRSRLLTSGGLGTMGYGLPSALGAKLGVPDMPVVSISGDGGFQMNEQELATAVCEELPVVICILNNSYLGNVRQWQEMFFGGRYSCTCLKKRKSCAQWCSSPGAQCPPYLPDFVKLAESYGIEGIRVTDRAQIGQAFEHAKATKNKPTLIEFIIDRELDILPMVPGGNALSDMVTTYKKEDR